MDRRWTPRLDIAWIWLAQYQLESWEWEDKANG